MSDVPIPKEGASPRISKRRTLSTYFHELLLYEAIVLVVLLPASLGLVLLVEPIVPETPVETVGAWLLVTGAVYLAQLIHPL